MLNFFRRYTLLLSLAVGSAVVCYFIAAGSLTSLLGHDPDRDLEKTQLESTSAHANAINDSHHRRSGSITNNDSGTHLPHPLRALKEQAIAGDAQAASRLFEELRTCMKFHMTEKQNLEDSLDALKAGKLEATSQAIDALKRQLDFIDTNSERCAEVGKEQLSELVPATLRAAKLGDVGAIDCYVAMGIFGVGAIPGLVSNPQWLSEYESNIGPLTEFAISKGDWNVVTMLHTAHLSEGVNASILSEVLGKDSAQAYKYLKLLNYGFPEGNPSWQERLDIIANQISPDARRSAEAWADSTYKNFFRSSPITGMKGPLSCELS